MSVAPKAEGQGSSTSPAPAESKEYELSSSHHALSCCLPLGLGRRGLKRPRGWCSKSHLLGLALVATLAISIRSSIFQVRLQLEHQQRSHSNYHNASSASSDSSDHDHHRTRNLLFCHHVARPTANWVSDIEPLLMNHVYQTLLPLILSESKQLQPQQQQQQREKQERLIRQVFEEWYRRSLPFFTQDNMFRFRQSTVHAPHAHENGTSSAIQPIIDKLSQSYLSRFEQRSHQGKYPQRSRSSEPLRIMVFGGSVTKGFGCMEHHLLLNSTIAAESSRLRRMLRSNEDGTMGDNTEFGASVPATATTTTANTQKTQRRQRKDSYLNECAWPSHLNTLMNSWLSTMASNQFGGTANSTTSPNDANKDLVVHVTNMGAGGASSDVSVVVIDYHQWATKTTVTQLLDGDSNDEHAYPEDGPDLVIWDHSLNDAALYGNTKKENDVGSDAEGTAATNETAEHLVFTKMIQPFYHSVTSKLHPCKANRPLVVFVDDFLFHFDSPDLFPNLESNYVVSNVLNDKHVVSKLRNTIDKISGSSTAGSPSGANASFDNVMIVSYSNILRPYILEELEKQQPGAPNRYNRQRPKKPFDLIGADLAEDIHPGMMFHITLSWVVFYNLYKLIQSYCEDLTNDRIIDPPNRARQDESFDMDSDETAKPHLSEECILSRSSSTLSNSSEISNKICSYVWTVNRITNVGTKRHVTDSIVPYLSTPTKSLQGWRAEGFPIKPPRTGWVPYQGIGSYFELKLNIQNKVCHYFTVLVMTSYGDLWMDSTIQFTVSVLPASNQLTEEATSAASKQPSSLVTNVHSIPGYHDQPTSIIIPHKFKLPAPATYGDTVVARFELIQGKTAKICGMALCSW